MTRAQRPQQKRPYLLVLTMSSRAKALTGDGSSGRSSTALSRGSPGTICNSQAPAQRASWVPAHAQTNDITG